VRLPSATRLVILCRNQAEAEAALEGVRQWTARAGLQLHPTKTRIVDATQAGGFDFLGYHFERGMKWPRKKSLQKFKDAIRAKTKRKNGQSLQAIITDVNRTVRGWFEYFQHSHEPVSGGEKLVHFGGPDWSRASRLDGGQLPG
jgi:RNA-directed DNA polymerase